MIHLDYKFVTQLRVPHQLTIGRQHEDYKALIGKRAGGAELSQTEQERLANLERTLVQYSAERHASLQNEAVVRKGVHYGTTNTVILNAQKLAAADLTGAQRLAVHRESEGLGRLMRKPAATLSAGEKSELNRLQQSLLRFVGPSDRPGQLSDFKVTGT